jgi:hypothetical protein
MSELSSSPERNTFHKEKYTKRCEENGKEPDKAYIRMYQDMVTNKLAKEQNPDWRKNNLEYDLRSNEYMLSKVRTSDTYAQNLYAAMCNRDFQKLEVIPVLKEETWSCSWRYAGGIIADMRMQGDYIDWYCSGIGDGLGNGDADGTKEYVGEGHVTDEIREDLQTLGWIVLPHEMDDE